MASTVLNKVGKELFENHMEKYAPADPMYEFYTDDHGKKRRRRRQSPPGLSERDSKILQSVQKRAHYLDKGFRFCGMRVGWTFIIGIIPIVGDAADIILNYLLVVRKARQADLPFWLVRHMLLNNVVSAAAGLIPFVGDVVLALYKANSRNAALLEEFLRIRGEEYLRLRAEGKDPEKIAAEARATKKKGKGKGKEKEKEEKKGRGKKEDGTEKKGGETEEVVKGVTLGDVEQVKPGAGKTPGEVIPGTTTKSRKLSFSPFRKRTSPAQGKFVEDVGPSSATPSSGAAKKDTK